MNTTQFRPEFFSNFGWPDHLFYLQKPPPTESNGCPQNQNNGGKLWTK